MVEHLIISDAGALLLVLGLTGPLIAPILRIGLFDRLRVLANALLWSSGVLYPRYEAGEASWNISPANDQSIAGAIMMIEGSIVTICLFCWLFLRAARESEARQELVELAAARGVELSEERAARAVAAGRGEALRQRILEER
jgi:cytochrome c oxidase assembly factor CtaG